MKLTIQRLGHRSDGIAEGHVLVPLTLPGEEVEGEVSDGRMDAPRIVTPSPDRVRPACPHYRVCGGCSLMHASDGFVARWKADVVETALAARGVAGRVAGVATSPPRSRRRAVFSGRRVKKGALVGFHARASDVVADLTDCHVIRPAIQAALPLLRKITQTGASRGGELTIAVTETRAGLDVAVNGGKPLDSTLFSALSALADEGDLARLTWHGTAITRRPPVVAFGRAQVVLPPGGFLQATSEGEAALLAVVRKGVGEAARVVDLFSGAGTFTLPLAARAEVHAVEGLPESLAALDRGWRGAGLHKVTHEARDLARRPLMPDELAGFDAIVIDPPRAGAEAQAREIAQSKVQKLVWVSCDPVNFARDARILADEGFEVSELYVVDQFRWSPHVELVAIFRRR